MSEFDEIQNIIRLKRHEQPPPGFVDDFVISFQHRQRAELLNRSARGLLWERVTTYFADLLNPKWAWTAVTACALLGAFLMIRPGMGGSQLAQNDKDAGAFEVGSVSVKSEPVQMEQNLIARHYGGGLVDEQKPEQQPYITRPFAGGVQTVSLTSDVSLPDPRR